MIFLEYAVDIARAYHALGVAAVAVTAGYIEPGPRAEFFAHMDAANIDLKGFTERFYHRQAKGELAPVLDTLKYVRHETPCWLEITTLLIPGENDSTAEHTRCNALALEAWAPPLFNGPLASARETLPAPHVAFCRFVFR